MNEEEKAGGCSSRHQGAPGHHSGPASKIRGPRTPPCRENGEAGGSGKCDKGDFDVHSGSLHA